MSTEEKIEALHRAVIEDMRQSMEDFLNEVKELVQERSSAPRLHVTDADLDRWEKLSSEDVPDLWMSTYLAEAQDALSRLIAEVRRLRRQLGEQELGVPTVSELVADLNRWGRQLGEQELGVPTVSELVEDRDRLAKQLNELRDKFHEHGLTFCPESIDRVADRIEELKKKARDRNSLLNAVRLYCGEVDDLVLNALPEHLRAEVLGER